MRRLYIAVLVLGIATLSATSQEKTKDNTPPPGFKALFNGKDLTNWQSVAMVKETSKEGEKKKTRDIPLWLTKLSEAERAARQKESDAKVLPHWTVKNGVLEYDGKGYSLQTIEHFGDFELYVDWKIEA